MTHPQLVRLIRQRLDALGITQYQFHQRLAGKVSKQTVYNLIEHGKPVRTDTLVKMLDAVGLTITTKEGE